ncbi:redoxin domain-containing protein [Halosimplex litoreum]|uniref:thioredoxin-dependent peroxiredoxin n=1 Tax=Halosimplex litoreum TaxID=1198301 RepID=A0A7T3G109_9EURY|nr:redoxin domain-containing protein [Halosimplex litoreum]QPV63953.1 redoxin domain-containing protein [Halosimplex litoreum]
MLTAGDAAPDFILPGTDGEVVREYMLAEHTREGPVVLAFYLFDFHPACTDELCGIQNLGWFDVREDVTVLGISRDSAFSHRAFAREYDIPFPLLTDSDGGVSERYGVRIDELAGHRDVSNRAVFVVDADTRVRYAWAAEDPSTQPRWDEVRTALDEL